MCRRFRAFVPRFNAKWSRIQIRVEKGGVAQHAGFACTQRRGRDLTGKETLMNLKELRTLAVVLIALVLVLATGSALAANQNEMKAGKKAEIVLVKPAQVGGVTLPAGRYIFQHVVSAGQHIATFKGPNGTASAITTKVKCTNEPLTQKVTQTSVVVENFGGVDRIIRIEIAGEDVVHVL
jgi:hypothetical protein